MAFLLIEGRNTLGWLSLQAVERIGPPKLDHDVSIAIPARNEATCIRACLAALDASVGISHFNQVKVTVFVNNSNDATAAIARAYCGNNLDIEVVEATLANQDAHAGGARRRSMDIALSRLSGDGVIMTTDADSEVHPDWIAANLSELESGADAVAGVVTFRPGTRVPVAASRDAEWYLAKLQAQLHSLLDPRPQNQWPTHIWAWGASFAVNASAYRAIGGLPEVPLAEDRALAAKLDRYGFVVRRSHQPIVYTSHRRHGRAAGGFANLLSSYINDETKDCDAALEPTANLVRRLVWNARMRRRHADIGPRICGRMSQRLKLPANVELLSEADGFGHWWCAIEAVSPRLHRVRIKPGELLFEISRAQRLVKLFERTRRFGTPEFVGVE